MNHYSIILVSKNRFSIKFGNIFNCILCVITLCTWRTWGGGVDGPPSLEFLICCSISKRFYLQKRAFDFSLQDEAYFMGVGAAGGLWRHQRWLPSWILPRIRNQVKTARNGDFLCLRWKVTHKQALCRTLATRFTFIVEKSWKNMYFHSKMACPPPTYDVIYRNDHHWTWLKMSARDERTATENIKCWCFIL